MERTMASLLLLITISATTVLHSQIRWTNAESSRCFSAIYAFGDSMTDTGNLLISGSAIAKAWIGRRPYGETFFGKPTGRCSDGKMIIDYISDYFGLPLIDPYLNSSSTFAGGVNFAVAGATAQDTSGLRSEGIEAFTNVSLSAQIDWFLAYKKSFCAKFSGDCVSDHFAKALFVMGEIGGNDYDLRLLSGKNRTTEDVEKYIGPVVDEIGSALKVLIEQGGAAKIMVQNNPPGGCSPSYLSVYPDDKRDSMGCIGRFNAFAEKSNAPLRARVDEMRARFSGVRIVYADLFSATMAVLRKPSQFNLTETVKACCGLSGTTYNYDENELCGVTPKTSTACPDPREYFEWDGIHVTDAGNRAITSLLVAASSNFTSPDFVSSLCPRQLNIKE